jgi:putative FmdB family regulatory protein
MPIYEFECRKCKARSEVLQKLNDKPPSKCSKCGGRLDKITSAPAIQFKGSGWYVTDYAGKNGKKEKQSEEKSETAKSESEKSETRSTTSSDKSATKESPPVKKSSENASEKKKPSGD